MHTGNILVLGSYPCRVPIHGGQIRLAQIIAAYRRLGRPVQSINLYDRYAAQGQPRGPYDFDYPPDSPWRRWHNQAIPLIEDLTSGRCAAEDETLYRAITQAVQGQPALIHLEQPWLLPLVLRWRREGRFANAKLVYGSQNIEAPLKAAILRQYGIPQAQNIADEISQLERQACAAADLVLAVSRDDQCALQQLSDRPVVLAANGIAAWQADAAAVAAWRARLPAEPFALFVGSAHPPNISGFYQVLGDSLGFLPPDRKIVVAGSVGPHLRQHPAFHAWAPLNQSRLHILGLVDEADLAAIKSLAHVFILPICEGGGSNIKTAEALYAGSYVVGTPTSFRGFQEYLDLPGVYMAEAGPPFRRCLADLLQRPALAPEPAAHRKRQGLLWHNTLGPMLAAVQPLLAP